MADGAGVGSTIPQTSEITVVMLDGRESPAEMAGEGSCRWCTAPFAWARFPNGRFVPVTQAGDRWEPHRCPKGGGKAEAIINATHRSLAELKAVLAEFEDLQKQYQEASRRQQEAEKSLGSASTWAVNGARLLTDVVTAFLKIAERVESAGGPEGDAIIAELAAPMRAAGVWLDKEWFDRGRKWLEPIAAEVWKRPK